MGTGSHAKDTPAASQTADIPATLLDAAVAYADHGWPVFPCKSRAKRPLTLHGLKDATLDLDTVRAWWARWPDANVAVATGHGLVVVDLDGPEGCTAFRQLQRRHGSCGSPWWSQTARGFHAWYTADKVPSSAGRFATGIDVRGNGGYVIAPPSVHPTGHVYRWAATLGDVPGALPEWMRRLADPPAPARPAPVRVTTSNAYARAALEREARSLAASPVGGRNHALNKAAYSLGGLVAAGLLAEAEVGDALVAAAAAAGLSARETARTLNSGLTAGMAAPRQVAS